MKKDLPVFDSAAIHRIAETNLEMRGPSGGKPLQFDFRPTRSPWTGKRFPCFNLPLFTEHIDWMTRLRISAAIDGVEIQARHAAHLLQWISGSVDTPWKHSKRGDANDGWKDDPDPVSNALLRFYGPNPVPMFLAYMHSCGINPSEPEKIGAGNVLHTFHIHGDPVGTTYGWAILHRCPGAGSFGSWRTGAVYRWHSRPERMDETREQFEADYQRAIRRTQR